MALFRKFFYRKPPDGLLEISERVYVFDCCFTTDVLEEGEYKVYIGGIVAQLREHSPDASFMVFNFREGEHQSQIASILSEYDTTVMDYPRHYEGCPLLTMEMIHHFLRSSESWLSLGQHNVLLMHCERGGWPVLAFMLAGLLIYRKQYTGEQKTLDMIYKQAPRELLQLLSPLNPLPSQLRYLQYISRRNVGSEWPPLDRALTLDCVILRILPNFDREGGCRPIFRIYGQDPFIAADRTPKVLFSTPKKSKAVRLYKADCELVKIDIHCHIQGDVVLECISLDEDVEREEMMFRVMFNTAFIRSNILILNRDEIDILWNAKDRFPKDFRAEILLSEMDAASSVITVELASGDEKEGLPVEAFAKVQEIFSNVDWLDPRGDAALHVLQHITSSALQQKLDAFSPKKVETDAMSQKSSSGVLKDIVQSQEANDGIKKSSPPALKHQPVPSHEHAPDLNSKSQNIQLHDLQASGHPSQPTVVTQHMPRSRSTTTSFTNSLQGSPMPISRYHSAPSALGITALLHDHAAFDSSEVTHSVIMPPVAPVLSSTAVSGLSEPVRFKTASAPPPLPSSACSTTKISTISSSSPPLPSLSTSTTTTTAATATATITPPPPPPLLPSQLPSSASSRTKVPVPLPPLLCPPSTSTTSATTTGMVPPPPPPNVPLSPPPTPPPPRMPPPLPPPQPRSAQTIMLPCSAPKVAPLTPLTLASMKPSAPPQLSGPPKDLPETKPVTSTPSLHSQHYGASLVKDFSNSVPPPLTRSAPKVAPLTPLTSPSMIPTDPPQLSVLPKDLPSSKPVASMPSPHSPHYGTSGVSNSIPPPPPLPSSSGTSLSTGPPRCESSTPILPARPLPTNNKSSMSLAPPPPPPPPLVVPSSPYAPPSPMKKIVVVAPSPPPPPPLVAPSCPYPRPSPMKMAVALAGAPPPPPPPSRSGATSSTVTPCAPPPPPPPNLFSSTNPTSHKLSNVPLPPVPPPPATLGPQSNSSGSKGTNREVIPPPPASGILGSSLGVKGRSSTRTSARNTTTKRTNLRPLHWIKVTRAMQGSLWAEAQKSDEASKAPEIDMSELERLFSLPNSDTRSSTNKSSGGHSSLGQKSVIVQLIDLRRANNCEIMLTKVKMPISDLMCSLLALDDSVLDIDQIDNLIKFCPTKEEMDQLKGFNGDKENLGKCEQYFLELMKVPRVESKLRVFSFKIQFRSQVAELSNNLNTVNSAATEIRNSVKLRRIMQTILSLGNALNQGTARGSAIGFRLDSLLKLTDTRARNNKMTLMHYLCKVLAEKLPELLDFPKDLGSLEISSKIQLKTLAEEMQAISKGLEKVEQELTASENDGPVSETFHKTLKEFLVGAEAEVRALTSLYSNVGRSADALALYFGEDPARCPFEQVVSTLLNFVKMFVRAHGENCKQLELEKKKAQKEAENEKMKLGTSKKELESLSRSPSSKK